MHKTTITALESSRKGSFIDYPSKSRVELALKRLATEIGDTTAEPFRVELLKVNGGQPPRYTVVVVSPQQLLLRERLGSILGRPFSLGVRSFLLTVPEALSLLRKYESPEGAQTHQAPGVRDSPPTRV